MNKKGFTLIELLATLIILGILFTITTSAFGNYMTNSRIQVFLDAALDNQRIASQEVVLDQFELPLEENDVTIISTSLLEKENDKKKSPFGGRYLENKSYVVIVNRGTITKPKFEYYVALQDENRNALPLTNIDQISSDKFQRDAKNRMELTVQSFCGTEEGITRSLYTIKGLEEIQKKDEYGYLKNWNATIYSSNQCGRS